MHLDASWMLMRQKQKCPSGRGQGVSVGRARACCSTCCVAVEVKSLLNRGKKGKRCGSVPVRYLVEGICMVWTYVNKQTDKVHCRVGERIQ